MGVQKNLGPGQCAPTPRGAEPEAPRALLQGRGAAGGRAELAAAGRFSWECHFLAWSPGDFHRLLRCLRVFSSAWEGGGEGGRARLSAFLGAPERTRARGSRRPRGTRRPRGAAWGPLPGARCLAFRRLGRSEKQASCPSPALTPSFFSCLTNPRIIQLRKCWKEVSEGGGRRVEIFGSSVPECVRSGGSRWVGGWRSPGWGRERAPRRAARRLGR